jgi:nitrate reductase gamma subunit
MNMDLLDFARGPALLLAVTVLVLGAGWRLAGILRRPRMPDLSPAREGAPPPWQGALHSILRGLWPRRTFGSSSFISSLNGYAFHIGLALVFFGYAPHIAFIRRYTGLGWPALPDAVMYLAAGVTILCMLMALVMRLTDPVLKFISNADDWVSWALTFLPVITGMAVITESSAITLARSHVIYRDPLALHLLAFELLLIWFPFGKLMHAILFPLSRGATGVRFSHRGVQP